jgi:hypothetical protein
MAILIVAVFPSRLSRYIGPPRLRQRYQPKLLEPNLTAKEADRRIAILKAEIELANSY